MWLETKGIPDHKQYMFMLQLGNEGLCHWEYCPLAAPSISENGKCECIRKTLEGSFRHTMNFRSYREYTLNNFHLQESGSIADLHKRLTVLLDKCNYNQCYMNTHKVVLFIHTLKSFVISACTREQPASLVYDDWLLDKAKSYEAAVVEYKK